MSYTILTDTSANLPTREMVERNVGVIPLSYTAEGKEYVCLNTEDFRCEEYYRALKAGMKISTSQINPQKYIDYMEPILQKGEDILFIGMSSGISGSYGSAEIASEQLLAEYPKRKIRLVDSLGASLGEGLLVRMAIDCKEQGINLDATADCLLEKRKNIYQLFTVDDLMYLRRGGRLSNATAIVGSVLNVKPMLKGNEHGKIVTVGKVRGRSRVMEHIVQRYEELVVNPEKQVLGISHGNCLEDAKKLAEMLNRNRPPKDILIVEHEPVTGSYLGAGSLAIYFEGDQNVRYR